MAEAQRGILVDSKGEIVIRNGTLAIGETLTQEVALLLLTSKGEIRHDVLCGCDLRRYMNGRIRRTELQRIVRVQVERDGKNWDEVKAGINVLSNG